VAKPQERQTVHQVPRKKKGSNAKAQESSLSAIELQSTAIHGPRDKQLVQFESQSIQAEGDAEVQKKHRLDKTTPARLAVVASDSLR
jgi:uncharacterized phage infection (PIP) family protein YhgE